MEQSNLSAKTSPGECRQCCQFCDKLVEPASCLKMGCRFIYTYREEINGRLYFGCLHKVFKVEIDQEMMQEIERSKLGFGGVKVHEAPLSHCPFSVDSTFRGKGKEFDCDNMQFFDCSSSDRYCYKVVEEGSERTV